MNLIDFIIGALLANAMPHFIFGIAKVRYLGLFGYSHKGNKAYGVLQFVIAIVLLLVNYSSLKFNLSVFCYYSDFSFNISFCNSFTISISLLWFSSLLFTQSTNFWIFLSFFSRSIFMAWNSCYCIKVFSESLENLFLFVSSSDLKSTAYLRNH